MGCLLKLMSSAPNLSQLILGSGEPRNAVGLLKLPSYELFSSHRGAFCETGFLTVNFG